MPSLRSKSAALQKKARAARQFAHKSKQRAAVLTAQAELLLERLDQLEKTVLCYFLAIAPVAA